ncbi:MAG: succinate dehydrogenase cytochrome b subunit [Marinifilaceae bacterium]|jgi:succinate dehydrogenase / fumarate reductase cytochrome b subunit
MSGFMTSSIGKKVVMSVSGLFLIVFLLVHLTLNLFLVFDDSGDLFNMGAHFMGTNPLIKIMEPVLALGFIIHMIWAAVLTLQNMKARPIKYAVQKSSANSSWASRNMFILGGTVLTFLVLHIFNFYWKIKVSGSPLLEEVHVNGVAMENAYLLVSTLFKGSALYCVIYMLGAAFLGLHLTHGFWSAFQSVGFSNDAWRKRLGYVSYFFAIVIGLGFAIIPLYFMIKF